MSDTNREIECNATGTLLPWSQWRRRHVRSDEMIRSRVMVFGGFILFAIMQITTSRGAKFYRLSGCRTHGTFAPVRFASFEAALEKAKELVG